MKRLIIIAAIAIGFLLTVSGQKPTTVVGPKAQPTPTPSVNKKVATATNNANTNSSNTNADKKADTHNDESTKSSTDKGKEVKQVSVSSDDIARLPAGKNYVMDTRHGSIYDFDTSSKPVDFSRIKLRTDAGEISMESLLQKLSPGGATSTHLRVGSPKDLRRKSTSSAQRVSGAENFTCDGARCDCKGDDDCNNMFGSNVCGSIALCREDGTCSCLRIGEK